MLKHSAAALLCTTSILISACSANSAPPATDVSAQQTAPSSAGYAHVDPTPKFATEEAKSKPSPADAEDSVLKRVLDSGLHDAAAFRRSGAWSAELCAMSDAIGLGSTRAGNAGLSVWQKTKSGWRDTGISASTPGIAIRELQMRCAKVSVGFAGTFYLDTYAPTGANFIVKIRGGGQGLRISTAGK